MKKIFKRLCTGFLAFATIVTALPTTAVHAESKQYWTQSNERVGIVEKVMNDGSIGSTFNEGHLTVDGEDAYCIDINTDFIDMHTVHETETIQLRLNDTNGIENFVKNFCKSYYTWDNSKEAIETRTQEISNYLTKELQDLNLDTIRTDIPTSSTVTNVLIWDIEQSETDDFIATYEVDQQIKEGEQTTNVKATYTVKVHVDKDGDMVIIQNPTLAPAIEKSDYEPKAQEADASVDADTVNDATAFLETFFKLYPTATEKELAYYVAGNVLEPIGRDYLYSELVNPVFTVNGDNVKVKVAVKFIDNQTKATQVSQFELVLHKDSNWKIIG